MPGIAIKYWAFQQTGWGHVDETVIPPAPEEARRSDYQDWKWVGVPQPLNDLEPFKQPILHVEPNILTLLQFFTYTTAEYKIHFTTQERLRLASLDNSILLYEYHVPSFIGKKLRASLSLAVGSPRGQTSQSIFAHNPTLAITTGSIQQEYLRLQWQTNQHPAIIVHQHLPLSVSIELHERREYQTTSLLPLPWHIRTSILEYVRWRTPLTISFPSDMDDETLLAALAHIVVEYEENEQ